MTHHQGGPLKLARRLPLGDMGFEGDGILADLPPAAPQDLQPRGARVRPKSAARLLSRDRIGALVRQGAELSSGVGTRISQRVQS